MLLPYKTVFLACSIVMTLFQTGCHYSREKLVVIEPAYSFVREGVQLANRNTKQDMTSNYRLVKTNIQTDQSISH